MSRHSSLLAVASGKGGVGKTWLAVTLAQALAANGCRSVLLDGDIGLANVDIQLGLAPTRDLSLWATGASSLDGLTMRTGAGFDIIPGASGGNLFNGKPMAEITRLMGDFSTLAANYDLGLIDIGAGIEPTQLRLASAAGRSLLVVTEDPTSLTDGYAFIKMAHKAGNAPTFEVVVNMAETYESGRQIYAALSNAAKSFLGIEPALAGVIRRDPAVARAIRRQTALLNFDRECEAAQDVRRLASTLMTKSAAAA